MQKISEILYSKISENRQKIDQWFAEKFVQHPPLFYNSIDLRHSDFKIAPVDTNCFPAGFNNVSDDALSIAQKAADTYLSKYFPAAKNILIIPENHTRNLNYLASIANLKEILSHKRTVEIGSLIPDLLDETTIEYKENSSIKLHPLEKITDKITLKNNKNFAADLILLNSDLTKGIPDILQNIATPIIPSPNLGWFQRSKSQHFTIYNQLVEEFAQLLDLDSWLISTMHFTCNEIDFKEKVGVNCLSSKVAQMLDKLAAKYDKYSINQKPYCYVKADNGTYGMAVMPVFEVADVAEINKKNRNKMNMLKDSVRNDRVMVQEGIITADRVSDEVAEPMIYMVGGQVIANFVRVNNSRNDAQSLNHEGMKFFDVMKLSDESLNLGLPKNKIVAVYEVIAKLAALAAAKEEYNK